LFPPNSEPLAFAIGAIATEERDLLPYPIDKQQRKKNRPIKHRSVRIPIHALIARQLT